MLAIAAVVMIYLGGYCYVRSQGWLVHRSGFAHGNTDNHSVGVGDLGRGGSLQSQAAAISHVVFTPLRWAETAYWYLRHPAGTPWPYTAGP